VIAIVLVPIVIIPYSLCFHDHPLNLFSYTKIFHMNRKHKKEDKEREREREREILTWLQQEMVTMLDNKQ
jgi:hypothetical protein